MPTGRLGMDMGSGGLAFLFNMGSGGSGEFKGLAAASSCFGGGAGALESMSVAVAIMGFGRVWTGAAGLARPGGGAGNALEKRDLPVLGVWRDCEANMVARHL